MFWSWWNITSYQRGVTQRVPWYVSPCSWVWKRNRDLASLASQWPGDLLQSHLHSGDMGCCGLHSRPSMFFLLTWHHLSWDQTLMTVSRSRCVQDEAMPLQSVVWEYDLCLQGWIILSRALAEGLSCRSGILTLTSQFSVWHNCVS